MVIFPRHTGLYTPVPTRGESFSKTSFIQKQKKGKTMFAFGGGVCIIELSS
jgi:hypothetical protein